MAAELRLKLLGGLQLTLDTVPITGFVSTKVQALLCYLAVTGRAHSRSHLAGLLWGDMPEAAAAGNLRRALHNLNQLVEPHITSSRQEVAFNPARPHWLDVAAFEQPLQNVSLEADPQAWRRAVALYDGDLLEGFVVRDAPSFDEWLLVERERLRDLAARALESLAQHAGLSRDFEAGLDFSRRVLSLEPWREEAHQQTMSLLAQSGQRTAALAQYETCRRILKQEFGVEPAPATTALYERIRDVAAVPPTNLPQPSADLIGRDAEMAQIAELLSRSDCRLLVLVGISGIGKTRLALAAAHAQIGQFPDGIFWVPLAAVGSEAALVPAMADALGLRLVAGHDSMDQLLGYLGSKQLLLVLDSFENVLDGSPTVVSILAQAPGVKLLVTSTERLRLQGEWLLPIVGLSVPPSQPEQALEAYSAVRLLRLRAQQMGRRDPWPPAELSCAARICQLVNGMPLAIELAASWVRVLPCAEIAREIEHNRDFLAATLVDLPERHRNLRAVFDYTWTLLAPAEREVFSRLAIFSGGFERSAAEQVADATLPILATLIEKSLLTLGVGDRYQMHDLLRAYARERLEQGPLLPLIQARHFDYYHHLAQAADPKLHGVDQVLWLDRLEDELPNFRAALNWGLANAEADSSRDSAAALELAGSLGLFWDLRGHFQEGRQWLERALTLPALQPPGLRWQAARSQALYWAGHLAKWQGDYRHAALLARSNLEACRERGDRWATAYALYLAGSVANKQGELETAQTFLRESLALLRQVKARWGLAHTLGALGNVARAYGRYDEAASLWQESYDLYAEIGDRRGLARTLNRMWQLPYQQGDYERALTLLEEAAGLFREIKHRDGVAIILRHMGLVATATGDRSRARVLLNQSRATFQELGDEDDLALANLYLGSLELDEGHWNAAHALLEHGHALALRLGNQGLISRLAQKLAVVARHQLNRPQACAWLQQSLATAVASGEPDTLSGAIGAVAELALAQGVPETATRLLGAAAARLDAPGAQLMHGTRSDHDRRVMAAQAQMDPAAFATAWSAGQALAEDEAVAHATDVLKVSNSEPGWPGGQNLTAGELGS